MQTGIGRLVVIAIGMTMGAQAAAQSGFCPDRPGKGTPPCIVDAGHVQLENSLVDWSRTKDEEGTEDTFLFNDALVRYGITDATELRLGWTSMGLDRMRSLGATDRRTRVGDVTLGLRHALQEGGQEAGFGISVQPFVSLPTGRAPIGAGTWGGGLIAPMQLAVSKAFSITFDPEVDALPDEDGTGRHLAYSTVFDLNWQATDAVQLTGEAFVQRDRDPAGRATLASLDLAAAYQIGEASQIDLGAYAGLNKATPRVQLVLGLAHRF